MATNLETYTNHDEPLGADPTPCSKLSGDSNNSLSDNEDERLKTEEDIMLHHSGELRNLLMEYKMSDVKMRDEIRLLRSLAEFYQKQYEVQTDLWMSGVWAHGLWMACSSRDPENPDYIQSAFALMNSKLSTDQLSAMNTENKELLTEYRETHRTHTSEVKSLLSNIDSNDWSNNHEFLTAFTSAVKDLSDSITTDVKDFFCRLIDQSVESLGTSPPCGMAVIAIGSLARCETTSYSDVEYMFLIEEDSDSSVHYFRRLAFQTYYFLSMLGESSLKTYNIKELNAVGFIDRYKQALRIDGLGRKAGNQPTGNEVDGSELLFTLDQLLSRYQSVLLGRFKGPEKGVLSDFVDMITHRNLVWSTGNGDVLYTKLEETLNNVVHTPVRITMSRRLLLKDVEEYSFLPKLNHKHSGHHEVKRDLYRYPSLLLTGLNNVLDLKSRTNWETIDKLVTGGTCSDETGVVLTFLLASSLFIRVDCYNFYHEQNDKVTIFAGEKNSPQYSCPRDLFILMTSYLLSLKPLMVTELSKISHAVTIPSFKIDSFQAVCIANFYCGAYDKVVNEFASRYGEEMMFDQVDDFLQKVSRGELESLISSLSESNSLTERHVKLLESAAKFYPTIFLDKLMAECYYDTNPPKALLHAQEHVHKLLSDDLDSAFYAYIIMSQCHRKMKDFYQCEELLNSARTCLDGMMKGLNYTQEDTLRMTAFYLHNLGHLRLKEENYDGYLKVSLQALNVCERLYGPGVIHAHVASSLNNIGLAYCQLYRYPQSLDYYTRALDMQYALYGSTANEREIAITLMNLGSVKRRMGQFEPALDFLTRSYKMNFQLYSNITPAHPDITWCVNHIAGCHYDKSDYIEGLRWYKMDYTNLTAANVVDKESLAICTHNMSICQKNLENYKSAAECFGESLKLYREINRYGKYDREITKLLRHIQQCKRKLSL